MDPSLAPIIVKSEAKEDRVGDLKTLYNVSGWSIFWRNFLAGFSRAVGGIFIYLIFVGISLYLFIQTVWPTVQPMLTGYMKMMDTLTNGGRPSTNTPAPPTIPGLDTLKNDPLFQQLVQKYQNN
jgi:hypothetical protein